jgi:outer membrane protein OmpA-like peptidoglycan-associated protein
MSSSARQAAVAVNMISLVFVCLAISAAIAVADPVVLAESGGQFVLDCAGKDVVVSGNGDKLVLSGGCRSLTISGDANQILADMAAGAEINLRGSKNNLAWTRSTGGVDPSIVDGGRANRVVRFRHEAESASPTGAPQDSSPSKSTSRAPDSIESAKRVAASKSMQDIKKDLGVKEGPMGEMAEIPNEVMFAFNSDQLRPDAVNILAECAEMIKRDGNKDMRVIGHTDSVGSLSYNLDLSNRRAEVVKTWLVNQGGIPKEDLIAVGLGPKKPKASNGTAEGRAKNRRVEVLMPMGETPHQPLPDKK